MGPRAVKEHGKVCLYRWGRRGHCPGRGLPGALSEFDAHNVTCSHPFTVPSSEGTVSLAPQRRAPAPKWHPGRAGLPPGSAGGSVLLSSLGTTSSGSHLPSVDSDEPGGDVTFPLSSDKGGTWQAAAFWAFPPSGLRRPRTSPQERTPGHPSRSPWARGTHVGEVPSAEVSGSQQPPRHPTGISERGQVARISKGHEVVSVAPQGRGCGCFHARGLLVPTADSVPPSPSDHEMTKQLRFTRLSQDVGARENHNRSVGEEEKGTLLGNDFM